MLRKNLCSRPGLFKGTDERRNSAGDTAMNASNGARQDDDGRTSLGARLTERSIGARSVAASIRREISALDPSYFALVMATGIVSNGFYLQEQRAVSNALLAVAVAAYVWLGLLTGLRAALAGAALRADLANARTVFLFFTFVAATDVLGIAIGVRGFPTIALAMWGCALAVWVLLIYLGFGVLMILNTPGRADVVNGAWLNAIVATQSLVILGVEVILPAGNFGPTGWMMVHMLWIVGLGLYGIYVALLCQRMFFFDVKPDDVTPPLWIVMGAAAISANAGSALAADGAATPFLRSMQPFVDGVTLGMWAWATWWIPLLILLGIWKHGIRRVPIVYTPMLWSIVFPIGMYGVASFRLSHVAGVPALESWSWAVAWIALAAWSATAMAFVIASFRSIRAFVRPAA
jgi:tellurite resistance protein TehA-like permease